MFVEGIVDHHLLGIHHVNETVPHSQRIYWDVGFLFWGAIMLVVGWAILKLVKKRRPKKVQAGKVQLFRLIADW